MALTQITDVVVPRVFTPYMQLLSVENSAFVQSGVAQLDPEFDSLLSGGGRTFDLPFYNDLSDNESRVSGDAVADVQVRPFPNPGNDSSPDKITTGQEVAIRHSRNRSWSSADLTGQLSGDDPQGAIASRVAAYWTRQYQRLVIASIRGVIADNIANDGGDMVTNISTAGAVTDANRFSAEAFIDAVQTMGDQGESLVAIAVHSIVYRRMQKLNLIDFIPDARGEVNIPFFLGRRVIVDDGLPTFLVGANPTFSCYLFGTGAIALAVGSPKVPTEVEREPAAGNGGGQEVLYSRQELLVHPRGFAWQSAAPGANMAGQSPTNAELALAANWDRRFARKLIRLAELRVNS